MRKALLVTLSLAAAWCLAASLPALAQGGRTLDLQEEFPELPTLRSKAPAAPRMRFVVLREIPLPGPLGEIGPRFHNERIRIDLGGTAYGFDWSNADAPELLPADPATTTDDGALANGWAHTADGRFRYMASATGFLLAQRRCPKCNAGWRRKWRLRIAGPTEAPPLVTERRVFFGTFDNRVFSVKRRSGHRVWAVDVGSRVSRPLVLWEAPPPLPVDASAAANGDPLGKAAEAREAPLSSAILAVPDLANALIALDPGGGGTMATFTLPEGAGRLVGVPVGTPDGRIVVAWQKYTPTEAALLVLDLELLGTEPAEEQETGDEAGAAADEPGNPRRDGPNPPRPGIMPPS